jgi:hypothetical protein
VAAAKYQLLKRLKNKDTMANNKTHLKKHKDYICCICKKEHHPDVNVGNSVGDGQILGDEIAGGAGKSNYLETHSFCRKRPSRSRKKVVYSQIQAHHLICGEAMDDKKSPGKYTWEQLCNSFGYDINCKENGVNLPSCLEVACIYMVPLHRGNHKATEGSIGLNYVDSVKELIKSVKEDAPKYCNNPKGFIEQLNSISNEIFGYIKSFAWTITFDGRDYGNSTGCLDCNTIPEKRLAKLLRNTTMCEHEKNKMRTKYNLLISK